MQSVVWVSSWQMECCGDAFAVGDRIDWTVEPTDGDSWLSESLGAETAARITHAEEHHSEKKGLSRLSGRVASILGAWSAYAPQGPGWRTLHPVPESARFVDVLESEDVRQHAFSSLRFNGWVVEVLEEQ